MSIILKIDKDNSCDEEAPRIIFLCADPLYHGYGHISRCGTLQKYLQDTGRTSQLITGNLSFTAPAEIDSGSYLIILDARDIEFPEWAFQKNITRIAFDNRGPGRSQADYVFDLLPHFAMNDSEFSNSLRNIILPYFYKMHKNKVSKSSLQLVRQTDASRTRRKIYSSAMHPYRMSSISVMQKIQAVRQVQLYFGQTLFEALFLGADVKLYSISEIHYKLAQDFFRRWRGLPTPQLYFDGSGAARMAQAIMDISAGAGLQSRF